MRTKIYLLKIELLIKMKNANNFIFMNIRFCDCYTALLLKLKQKINYLKYNIF